MRKLMATILCILMVLLLISCGIKADIVPDSEPTADTYPVLDTTSGVFKFPEGCIIGGIDLTGMLGVTAYDALDDAAENYVLQLNINDNTIILTSQDIELSYSSEQMQEYVNALKEGKDPSTIFPFTYNKGLLRHLIATELFQLPENAPLVYNTETDSYEFTEVVPGIGYDMDSIMKALDPIILSLGDSYTATVATTELTPAINPDSDSGKAVLEKANGLLTSLSYNFTPKNSRTRTETLDADSVGSFLGFDENYQPVVDEDAVKAYAEILGKAYSVGSNDGKFLNSLGEYVDIKINYAEQLVDVDALAADIQYCFENGITGTREAPYLRAENSGRPYDLGGNYVEINLTKQRLWVYENYECKLYTNIVTGNVSEGWVTPTGVYSVYQRVYPTRAGRVFRYWMPFLGAYGLHDANWRSEFRSDEYLFEGSHGCVNIPPTNFLKVYEYVDIGTPVIIYGGANNGNPVEQVISGVTEYNVGVGVGTFTLDAKPKYGDVQQLSYTSDNPEVATVSNGVVKVLSTGTANITVTSKDWSFCPSVQKVISINVHEDCSETGHTIVNWKQTTASTCTKTGTMTGKCSACDHTVTVTTGYTHNFSFPAYMHPQMWVVTKWPTCSEAGEKIRTCQKCGYEEVQAIPTEDHVPVGWCVEDPVTAPNIMTAHCYHCGLEITKEIPPQFNS